MKMPGIDGIETFKEINRISPDTIIFLMTAFLDEDALNDATKIKVQKILYKPLDLDLILKILKEDLTKTTVLVVDDESAIRDTLQGALEERGCKVYVTADGYTAIQMTRNTHFDIMLIDVLMPGIDGYQTLEEIKKIDPATKVIMMTGQDIKNFSNRSVSGGAFAYITKPVNLDELLQLTISAIEKE
jgi:two-component system response regulator HydG